jgi:outer membrane protein assembly factor BamA
MDTIYRVHHHSYRFCDLGLEITDRVKESFQHDGYFCADVEPILAQRTGKHEYTVNIYVRPGEQYRVGELNFSGTTILSPDELRAELHMKPNSVFNTESVRRGVENIEKSCGKKGHPHVTAIPVASVDEKNRKIALEIKIQESGASQQVP